MEFAIFDLDGCVSDDRPRRHLLPRNKSELQALYALYHSKCCDDVVAPGAMAAIRAAEREGLVVLFVTGRPNRWRDKTAAWITERLGIDSPTMFMRPDGNAQPSPELKVQALKSRGVRPEQIQVAYDDRDDVLDAYAAYGVPAHRLHKLCVVETPPAKDAAAILTDMGATYAERNKVYGDNYKNVGKVMEILHGPDSAAPASTLLNSADDFNVWHLYELMIVKLTRFANSGLTHQDSIHDTAIYAAMIESLLEAKGEDQ